MEKDVFLIKEISKDCKISMESIRKVSEYLGIKYFKNGRNFSINYDSYLQLEEFYKNHMTLDNLCRKCEVSFDWVRRRNNKIKFNPLVLGRFSFYDKKDEQILRNFLNENKYQPINNDKLAKFALSKYLKISRNRLNTLLNQLPPTEDEFDGKYYTYDYADKLKENFENQVNIKVDEFKRINKCYSMSELSKEFDICRAKIKNLINDYDLEMIEYGNLKFCSESTKLKLEELIKDMNPNIKFKNGIDGYVKFSKCMKFLNLNRKRLKNLLNYYNLELCKIGNILFVKNNDFDFLKSLYKNNKINDVNTTKISKIRQLTTLSKLCKEFNISVVTITNAIKSNKLNLNPKKYKNINIYDDESRGILKLYLDEQRKLASKKKTYLSHNQFAKYLKISRGKLTNYLQYFKPNSEEFDGKYYTYEFADKMKEFMDEHPSIRQNKVYVRELNNMEFDSKAEAYYYCYMKDHNHNIKHHPLNLYYLDSNGKKRRYEVDFMVDGKLVEIKGDIQFDENGKPYFRKKSWQEKYDCMIENNVEMILSSEFDENGIYKHMRYYFHEKYSFVKYIKELTEDINEKDIKYMSHLRQSLAKNSEMFHCIETNESHFNFEWFEILHHRVNTKSKIYGHTYIKCSSSEQNSYILSKIEELRSKGLDVSWFDKNKEKYLKTENEETIFNL